MDAVEYVKQRERMCDYYVNCGDCPADDYGECTSLNEIPNLVPIVEQWAKEHHVKTRQDEFLISGLMLRLAMMDYRPLLHAS